MLSVVVPAQHAEVAALWAEEQEIMTCEPGYLPSGEFHISPHGDDSNFWLFVEELLVVLPSGTELKLGN